MMEIPLGCIFMEHLYTLEQGMYQIQMLLPFPVG